MKKYLQSLTQDDLDLANFKLSSSSLSSYINSVAKLPKLEESEEFMLFDEYINNNNMNALYKLIVCNLNSVVITARKYQGYNIPLEDLIQEGNIGLLLAIDKFKLSHGFRFYSFSIHYIKASILSYITKNGHIIKAVTTKNDRKLFFNINKFEKKGTSFSDSEIKKISDTLNVPTVDIKKMEQLKHQHVFDVDDTTHDDSIYISSNYDILYNNMSSEGYFKYDPMHILLKNTGFNINDLLSCLNDREQFIFSKLWLEEEKWSLTEVGKYYNVSPQRIDQIQKRIFQKIKQYLEKNNIEVNI